MKINRFARYSAESVDEAIVEPIVETPIEEAVVAPVTTEVTEEATGKPVLDQPKPVEMATDTGATIDAVIVTPEPTTIALQVPVEEVAVEPVVEAPVVEEVVEDPAAVVDPSADPLKDELTTVVEALEAMSVDMKASLESGGLTPEAASIVRTAIHAAVEGLDDKDLPIASVECFSFPATQRRATEISIESIDRWIANIRQKLQ